LEHEAVRQVNGKPSSALRRLALGIAQEPDAR
jgi:hypothetical protein